jgi:hypothetical protein
LIFVDDESSDGEDEESETASHAEDLTAEQQEETMHVKRSGDADENSDTALTDAFDAARLTVLVSAMQQFRELCDANLLSAVVEAHPAGDIDQLLLRIATQVLQRADALAQREAPAFVDGVKADAQVLAEKLLSSHPDSFGVLHDVALLIALLRPNHDQVSGENIA